MPRPFDLETGVQIASKVGNLHFKFGHATPLGSRIIRYVRHGRTDGRTDKSNVYCPLPCGWGIKGLDTCYSATYMSQTRDQQRFTISEVAADWHEPMVPQRIMWPSIAGVNGQLDPRRS